MLTFSQLLEIVNGEDKPKRFWVDIQGKRHSISGSISTDIVGGFKKNPNNRGRRYFGGEALYYKV